ncbi:MAG TPA: sugar transferase [Bacteroidales bacterium]|nr:sugar transferase [Bacteroidales bacterium]
MDRANFSFYRIVKTSCDYIFAAICLIVLSPLAIILCILVFTTGGGPVIYSQKRSGRNGKTFMLYKFRSLRHGANEDIDLIADKNDLRITRIGKIMRRYKLDEIPNFLNVLRGEMSVVGPRPEQEYYIEKIIRRAPEYSDLLKLKPGVTSWGEVKYGYASNLDQMVERLEYDLYYLEHRSLMFDLKIIFETIGIVLRGRGI